MVVVTAHQLEGVEVDEGYTSVCTCGWRSGRVLRRASAETRWNIHCRIARAATTYGQAAEVRARAARQAAEARARRFAARQRADELRALAATVPATPGARRTEHAPDDRVRLLEDARALAGLSVPDLWVRYVMLGGSARMEELSAMLDGAAPLSRYEHDVIALALNEYFADAGFGHPIDFWSAR